MRARTTPSFEETKSANMQNPSKTNKKKQEYLALLVSQNTCKWDSPLDAPEVASEFLGVPTNGLVPFLATLSHRCHWHHDAGIGCSMSVESYSTEGENQVSA